jgi:archaellum component FlaC
MPCSERIGKMENDRLFEIINEITALRENLHQLFMENEKVTREMLQVSTLLDQRINSYIKLDSLKDNW